MQELESNIQRQSQQSQQLLTDEINELKRQLDIILDSISQNLFDKIKKRLKLKNYKKKIKQIEEHFDFEVRMAISELVGNYNFKNNRYQFIQSYFNEAVRQSANDALKELDRKKRKIDELNSFIYGALGEQKVVKTLEVLSDEYYLINDFKISFSRALHNKQENDYIKSVQIDHILVAPSGVFLIETKNWSEKSLENLSLRSPVEQIKRTSFVLFKLLNNEISNYQLKLERHHWGNKKIPIKNLIVLTNTKPKEEFQYVKILTLNELLGYVNYFKPIYSSNETESIANFLLLVNKNN